MRCPNVETTPAQRLANADNDYYRFQTVFFGRSDQITDIDNGISVSKLRFVNNWSQNDQI